MGEENVSRSARENQVQARSYQVELLEKAILHNVILSLPTGSGKTFIAVQLLKELCSLARYSSGAKRGFFLVPTVPLVEQQAREIRVFSSFKVGEYHGKLNVDYWSREKWLQETDEHHILVMTAQVFLNMLDHGIWAMEDTSVIVMDECHKALGGADAYRQIMAYYNRTPNDRRPRILGLTASPIRTIEDARKLDQQLRKLERVLHGSLDTSSEFSDIHLFGTQPEIVLVRCLDFIDHTGLTEEAVLYVSGAMAFLKDADFDAEKEAGGDDPTKVVKREFRRLLSVLRQFGPWCGWKVAQQQDHDLGKLLQVDSFQRKFIDFGRTTLRHVKEMLDEPMRRVRSTEQLYAVLPNRVRRLMNILEYEPLMALTDNDLEGQKTAFSGIVFVKEQYAAFILCTLVEHIKSLNRRLYRHIKPAFIVGYSNRQGPGRTNTVADTLQQESLLKRQNKIMEDFRDPASPLNLLFATSVIEEGIHVGQVNCVVRFDVPEDYRAYVQSKGRARKKGAFYFMLDEETHYKEKYEHIFNTFALIEKQLRERCANRSQPEQEETEREFEAAVAPFYPVVREAARQSGRVRGQPSVSVETATALLFRYCASLPSDGLTRLVPNFKVKEVRSDSIGSRSRYWGCLRLPINCRLRQSIQTDDTYVSETVAKNAAALIACKLLYECGELNDNLIPVGRESLIELMRLQDPDDEVDSALWRSGGPPPGSTRRRQYYDKRIATTLHDTAPGADMPLFLHRITLRLVKPAEGKSENPKDRKYRDPASSSQCFGVLSSKKLPILPSFPIYGRPGELQCSFDLQPETVQLSKQDLDQACKFHEIVFAELLKLDRQHMRFDAQQEFASNGLLLVPLSCTSDSELNAVRVDLAFITEIISSEVPKPLTEEQQQNFVYDESRYEDAVVFAWYMKDQSAPQFYFVSEIMNERSPESSFPDEDYDSFVEYYHEKHGLTIHHRNTPLLAVEDMSNRLNVLTPAIRSRKSLAVEEFAVNEQHTDMLIPELLQVYPIPASLFSILTCVPSALYRLNTLLLADELRCEIQTEALHLHTATPAVAWPPLKIDARQQQKEKSGVTSEGEAQSREVKMDVEGAYTSQAIPVTAVDVPTSRDLWSRAFHQWNEIDTFNPVQSTMTKTTNQSISTNVQTVLNSAQTHVESTKGNDVDCRESQANDADTRDLGYDSSNQPSSSASSYHSAASPIDGVVAVGLSPENERSLEEFSSFYEVNKISSEDTQLGPSPCFILQALTTRSACEGFNLERLETLGDSLLKYTMTVQLFITFPLKHEGHLAILRSKLVSNYHLYKLGKSKGLGERLVSTMFVPTKNWLPPRFVAEMENLTENNMGSHEQDSEFEKQIDELTSTGRPSARSDGTVGVADDDEIALDEAFEDNKVLEMAQQYISDKSIADAVEALIGVYLLTYGPHPAMLFMQWLGLKVFDEGCTEFKQPSEPLLRVVSDPEGELKALYDRGQFSMLERQIGYTFRNKAYLVQAFTHVSYSLNRVTDCYQRLMLLGDAVLDYLVTRKLYEDDRQHRPGVLSDIRSAITNNAALAHLAIRHGFQQFFLVVEARIQRRIKEFVVWLERHGDGSVNLDSELLLVNQGDFAEEKIEIPKTLSDVFEALAGAVFLDSGLSLATIWAVFEPLMSQTIEECCANPPKPPVRALMELDPRTTFVRHRREEGSERVHVTLTARGKKFRGAGRTYKAAKITAAKKALKDLK